MAMSTSMTAPTLPFWLTPIGWVGKSVIGVLSYLGGVAALMISAALLLTHIFHATTTCLASGRCSRRSCGGCC